MSMTREEQERKLDKMIADILPEMKLAVEAAPKPPRTEGNYAYYGGIICQVAGSDANMRKFIALALVEAGAGRGVLVGRGLVW